jgi:hypothetical protein
MATKSEEFFHDRWLGMVQGESDGLVVAKPILLEAGCSNHQRPEIQEKLREICPQKPGGDTLYIADLMQFFRELLDFDQDVFDSSSTLSNEASLYAPEGPQTIRPTYGLLKQDKPLPSEGSDTPASKAAIKYAALIWDVTQKDGEHNSEAIGLSLDKPETITGGWSYPAAAKFDRLLRHCRVPVGILTNREVIRLVYAPHGESSGHITFRVDDMATVGGRPILDAMIMLLCANQWFGVSDENSLPSLLQHSREYQGTVTEDLAEQVFSGLETLLKGFQTAAERDKSQLLREALELDEDHLYRGLLTVMLRLVFILYAEDRGLLPVDHPLYAQHMSLLGLFERLQRDHGNFPDSMNNRFGAWGQIISLSRAIYLGVEHGDFHIPPRQGDLFDPHSYPFLEGWSGSSAPVVTHAARAEVKVPTVDDGTVFVLLRSLLVFQGQRLSYRTLDVEQIGSVYEALMGYQVSQCESPAIAIKINGKRGAAKYWLEPEIVISRPVRLRVKWLQEECGFDKPVATKIKKTLDTFVNNEFVDSNAAIEALRPLAAGNKHLAQEQEAAIGRYLLQPGSERRRSGTQYTPRSLTEPIVRKTLEPLIRCLGEKPSADRVLELKICDPAMGSGAFLVESCRQLADEVVSAWGRAQEVEKIAADCPEGDVVAHARRLVAQRCLYGVDKNEMAVQLAKLSLWLFTLARDLPFTFLDHSFRYGDSLVGLDLAQINSFHWRPEKQLNFLEVEIRRAIDEVLGIRQEIHQLATDETPEGQKRKTQMLFDANDATERVRKIADVCVGAFFTESKENARLKERLKREDGIRLWLEGDSKADDMTELWAAESRAKHTPFHWWLEFPEVFSGSRSKQLNKSAEDGVVGMGGFVGNPPFMGKNTITESLGPRYPDWLRTNYTGDTGVRGACDLSAYFFRRCVELTKAEGAFGLVATNTIAQGDTRSIGLKHILVKSNAIIYDASTSMEWPGDAAVTVSVVHIAMGSTKFGTDKICLDGKAVPVINSRLRPKPERPDALKLKSNNIRAAQGSILLGSGFVVSPEEYEALILRDKQNDKRLFPYIGADEVNTSPKLDIDRYVINFEQLTLDESAVWPDLLEIVQERVKPEREQQKGNNSTSRRRRDVWWQFDGVRADLYQTIGKLDRCLVTACQGSKHLMFSFQPTNLVFAQGLFVFPLDSFTSFGILQSRIHDLWAWLLSSTMRNAGVRYAGGECFGTFPFPSHDPSKIIQSIEETGKNLYTNRLQYMFDTNQGLTEVYNLLKDPECTDERIVELRNLHEKIDCAVLGAYGWSDIGVPPYCLTGQEMEETTAEFNDEVIDRLYVLNAERVATENSSTYEMNLSKSLEIAKHRPESDANMRLPGMD